MSIAWPPSPLQRRLATEWGPPTAITPRARPAACGRQFIGDGIKSRAAPGLAAAETPCPHPAACPEAMARDGFIHESRTGRLVTALTAHHCREAELIQSDEQTCRGSGEPCNAHRDSRHGCFTFKDEHAKTNTQRSEASVINMHSQTDPKRPIVFSTESVGLGASLCIVRYLPSCFRQCSPRQPHRVLQPILPQLQRHCRCPKDGSSKSERVRKFRRHFRAPRPIESCQPARSPGTAPGRQSPSRRLTTASA